MEKIQTKRKRPFRTKNQFKGEIKRWAEIIKVRPQQISVRTMTRKWASCSTKRRVCFSADLLRESMAFQEYVIVHELLHLQIPNHGKLFKSMMNVYLPGWEKIAARQKVIFHHEKFDRITG